jgi:hypothetical protein
VGPNDETVIRNNLAIAFGGGVEGFWRAVILKAAAGDAKSMEMVTTELALFPSLNIARLTSISQGGRLVKADCIVQAVAAGELSPDVGINLINALTSVVRIIEHDELVNRLEELEQRLANGA